jgi:hypothetical protein
VCLAGRLDDDASGKSCQNAQLGLRGLVAEFLVDGGTEFGLGGGPLHPSVCIAEPGKPPTGPIGGSYALTAMRGACRQRASCAASRSATFEASE